MLKIRRPLFSLNCDSRLESQGNWLANLVSSHEAKPPGLHEGVRVQVGWSVTKLMRIGDELVLHEPDFSGNPFVDYRPDVTTTLTVLAMQFDLMSKLKCEVCEVRFDEKVVVQRGCLTHERIYAERQKPTPRDSGWYIGSAEAAPTERGPPPTSELEAIWVFDLWRLRPVVLAAMVLPMGWLVRWKGLEIDGIADHQNCNVSLGT